MSDPRRFHRLRTPLIAARRWHGRLIAFDCRGAPYTTGRVLLDLGVLASCGIALIALTRAIARWRVVAAHYHAFTAIFAIELMIYALAAAWMIWRKPPVRWTLALIFLIAFGARLAFISQTPTVSDDLYRYVWDGRVQAAGINPYRYAPNDPAVVSLRDTAIYPGINRKPVRTIYPPVAQAVFLSLYWLHPDSLAWTKLAFALLDLVATALLVGLLVRARIRPERVLLYAWHPLLILEVAHSGHIDVVAALFIVLALHAHMADRSGRTGVLLACATLIKLYALVALPAFFSSPRRNLRLLAALLATTALAYAPFLSVGAHVLGFLPGYARQEGITSGERYYVLHQATWLASRLPGNPAALLARSPLALVSATNWYEAGIVAAMMACAWWCWLRPALSVCAIADRIALLFIVLLTLATPSQPWYVLLLLACVPLVRGALLLPASIVVGSAGIGYLHEWFPSRPAWPLVIDYDGRAVALALLLIVAVVTWWSERKRIAASRADAGPASLATERAEGLRPVATVSSVSSDAPLAL